MKLITAFIRSNALEDVRSQLISSGIFGMTVTDCVGHRRDGASDAAECTFNGRACLAVATSMIEVVVRPAEVTTAVRAILDGSGTGGATHETIFISTIERVVRVRTGEANSAALSSSEMG